MEICEIKVYRGRNIYSHNKVIKLIVDLKDYYNIPTCKINDFNRNLLEYLPGLKAHRCSIGVPGGFVQRLKEGTYLAHVIEHCAIEILNNLNQDISFGRARQIDKSKYMVIYGYMDEVAGIEAGKLAVKLADALITAKPIDIKYELKNIASKATQNSLGPSTKAIYEAARRRGIPVTRIGERSILQLGYGKYSKRVEATITDNTSCVAVDIACDKLLTKEILYNAGIPVPEGDVCDNIEDAIRTAQHIGMPVVIKPQTGNQGKGVSTDLNTKEDIEIAFQLAKKFDDNIIVEKFIRGRDYRILVVDNQVVAVAQRLPAYVVGNGKNTIEELIRITNRHPSRGEYHEKPLTQIRVDTTTLEILKKQGYSLNSIPKDNVKVLLKPGSNLSTGGIAIDCTDKIHPVNRDIAIRAVSAIGLDIAGVDITCSDISKPITEDVGGVIEVNAAPGLRMHLYPSKGRSRDVGKAIVDMLYPAGTPHSIPIISVTGTNGKTTTVRIIAHIFKVYGYSVGMTTTGGIYVDDKLIMDGDTTGPVSAQTLLADKNVDVAILETARGGIIRSGLGYDLSDIGILTNISADHLGIDGIYTLDDLLHVKSLVVEAVKDNGYAILNADDPIVVKATDSIKSNIIYFSTHENNIVIHKHLSKGGTAVFIKDGLISIATKDHLIQSIYVTQIPATFGGKLMYNVENVLAAVSAAYALKVPIDIIERAVYSFYSDSAQNPGRFNIFNIGDFRIVLDYGHNIAGYMSVTTAVKKMGATRLIGIIGVPGDRDDDVIREIGKIAGQSFDHIIIKEDRDPRGRKRGEVAQLLKEGVLSTNNFQDHIIIYDEIDALKFAITNARPGDLIVVFYEKLQPMLSLIEDAELLKQQQENIGYKKNTTTDKFLIPTE